MLADFGPKVAVRAAVVHLESVDWVHYLHYLVEKKVETELYFPSP